MSYVPEEEDVEVTEDDYDDVIDEDEESTETIEETLRSKWGDKWESAYKQINRMFRTKTPGKQVPEYLELVNLDNDPNTIMYREALNDLRERGCDPDIAKLDFQTAEDGRMQVRYNGREKWYDLYKRTDGELSNRLSKEIKTSL